MNAPLKVVIAYHLQKVPYVFPIIGGRKVEHLQDNMAALDISLSQQQMERIESATFFKPGFPNSMIVSECMISFGISTSDENTRATAHMIICWCGQLRILTAFPFSRRSL